MTETLLTQLGTLIGQKFKGVVKNDSLGSEDDFLQALNGGEPSDTILAVVGEMIATAKSDLEGQLANKQSLAAKNQPHGYVGLDENAKIPSEYINQSESDIDIDLILGTATPQALGVATAGVATKAAREDHVHAMPTAAQVGAAADVHAHAVGDVTGLQTALDGKAAASHTHVISDTTGLQTALDGKAAADLSNVSNLNFANKASAAGVGGGAALAMAGVTAISSNYTVVSTDAGKLLRCTAALTLTLTSAATLGAGFTVGVRSETSGDVGIAYSGGSSINGYPARLILRPGQSIWLVSDGTGWRSIGQQSLSDYTWDRGIANGWLTLSADGYVGNTPSGGGFVGYSAIRTTVPIPTAKIYWEILLDNVSSTERRVGVSGITVTAPVGSSPTGWEYNLLNGQKVHNSVATSFGASVGAADVVGVACHIASGKIWFAKNNVWQASGNPATGASPAFDNLSGNLYAAASVYYNNQTIDLRARRSQQTYAPPSGFAPLAG